MRAGAGVVLCLLFGCASTPPPPTAAPAGEAPTAQPVSTERRSFGDHCRAKLSESGDAMMVGCDGAQIIFVLPGTNWTVEQSPVPSAIVFASSQPLDISVLLADPGETQYDVREHLAAIYQGAAPAVRARGFQITEAVFRDMPNGHVVLSYDVFADFEGKRVRSFNAWTALRRADRRYVDYHLSCTAPEDERAWTATPEIPSLSTRTMNLADAFFVTDGQGKLPPQ